MTPDEEHEAYGAMIHRGKVEANQKESTMNADEIVKRLRDTRMSYSYIHEAADLIERQAKALDDANAIKAAHWKRMQMLQGVIDEAAKRRKLEQRVSDDISRKIQAELIATRNSLDAARQRAEAAERERDEAREEWRYMEELAEKYLSQSNEQTVRAEAAEKDLEKERALRQTIEFHSEERWQKVAGANLIAANNALEKRAEAVEHDLAELRRKMREPDEDLIPIMTSAWLKVEAGEKVWNRMRAAWLAAVNHLLEGK